MGLFRTPPIKNIELDNYSDFIPAFLTLLIMPLSYSIAEVIIFGMLSYIVLKVFSGNYRQVSVVSYLVGALCLAKIVL